MIRINLLPHEDKGHRDVSLNFPKVGDLFVPIAVLVIVAVAIGGTALAQRAKLDGLTKSIAMVDEESRALAPQIERVNRLARERAELDLRLGIISKLKHGRTMSVRVIDEAASAMPDHVWLTGMTQEGEGVGIEGTTFSNLVVSEFMSRLERSPMFAGLELEFAERMQIGDRDVVKFRITCRVTPDEPAN